MLNESPPDWLACSPKSCPLPFTQQVSPHVYLQAAAPSRLLEMGCDKGEEKGLPFPSREELREVSKGGCKEMKKGKGCNWGI